jgi:hypothetical protein
MSFKSLKNRKGSIDKLVQAAQAASGTKNYTDERLWNITRDKAGNGSATIRFLPAAEGQDLPWNRYWDHGFQGPTGQWYIEKSLTSIGQDDPVGELNSKLWAQGGEDSEERKQARKQKRRLHYICNVLIVNDSANPENNGTVRIFKFGKKIFDKLMDSMSPKFADETPLDPFDMWKGANLKLRIFMDGEWPSYDKSSFDALSAISDNDDELEEIYNKMHNLAEFTDPAQYKSYDELSKRLTTVLGLAPAGMSLGNQAKMNEEAPAKTFKSQEAPDVGRTAESTKFDDDEKDTTNTMSYFASLAAEEE